MHYGKLLLVTTWSIPSQDAERLQADMPVYFGSGIIPKCIPLPNIQKCLSH